MAGKAGTTVGDIARFILASVRWWIMLGQDWPILPMPSVWTVYDNLEKPLKSFNCILLTMQFSSLVKKSSFGVI